MKLSNLWPRTASPAAVSKRAESESKRPEVRGARVFPEIIAECEVLEEELARDAIRLECQIGVAEGVAKAEGKYADPTWYHRARAALKHLQRDRQRLAVHMKALRRQSRKDDPLWSSYDQILIRIIAERISRELMDECKQLAQEKLDEIRQRREVSK